MTNKKLIQVNVSEEDYKKIEDYANKKYLTVTALSRAMILKGVRNE